MTTRYALPNAVKHVANATGWYAMIGSNPNPILFWAITNDNIVHGVIVVGQGLAFADTELNFFSYQHGKGN